MRRQKACLRRAEPGRFVESRVRGAIAIPTLMIVAGASAAADSIGKVRLDWTKLEVFLVALTGIEPVF